MGVGSKGVLFMGRIKIRGCGECSFMKSERVYTADSWEMVYRWECKAEDRVIREYVETFDRVVVPVWCPLMEAGMIIV